MEGAAMRLTSMPVELAAVLHWHNQRHRWAGLSAPCSDGNVIGDWLGVCSVFFLINVPWLFEWIGCPPLTESHFTLENIEHGSVV